MNEMNRFFVANLEVKEKSDGVRQTLYVARKHDKTMPNWDAAVMFCLMS